MEPKYTEMPSFQTTAIRLCSLLAIAGICAGCHTGYLPDPNVAQPGRAISVDSLYSSLEGFSYYLNQRQDSRQISRAEYTRYIIDWTAELSKKLKPASIPPAGAWKSGQIYRTARMWPEAEAELKRAVDWASEAKNPDRRVNDLLRLAQVQAEQGRVDDAIATARRTFDSKPEEAAPILVSILLELVPSAAGKKRDAKLADLLDEAAALEVKVDRTKDAGKIFMQARPFHLRKAAEKSRDLRSNSETNESTLR